MEIEPVNPDYIPPFEPPARSEQLEPLLPESLPTEESVDETVQDEDLGDNVDLMA